MRLAAASAWARGCCSDGAAAAAAAKVRARASSCPAAAMGSLMLLQQHQSHHHMAPHHHLRHGRHQLSTSAVAAGAAHAQPQASLRQQQHDPHVPPRRQQQHQQKQQQQKQQQHQQQQQQQHHEQLTLWPGLAAWRAAGVDRRRAWGPKNTAVEPTRCDQHDATSSSSSSSEAAAAWPPLPDSLVGVAVQVLTTADPHLKSALMHRGWSVYASGSISLHPPPPANDNAATPQQQQQQEQRSGYPRPPDRPARPDAPVLVAPKHVPSPKHSPLPLAAHLLHNLAHVELNAIDLACDTVARFGPLRLPDEFYEDFCRVADDEARHFAWCAQRLAELGFRYGDMPAHDLLLEGCQASAHDLGARLAVVPMSQEARGLDAGQRLVGRLVGAGDARSAAVVARIAAEERAHVAVGVAWFARLCAAARADAPAVFRGWLAALAPELLKGPFDEGERALVGLPRSFYDVAAWPADARAACPPPQAAAAAKGHSAPLSQQPSQQASQQLSQQPQQQRGGGLTMMPQEGAGLEELRQRLWQMLQAEAAAAGAGGDESVDGACS